MTMTLKELFNGIINHDIYELYLWASWFFDPARDSCKECIETYRVTDRLPPPCHKCIPPKNLIKKSMKDHPEKGDRYGKRNKTN